MASSDSGQGEALEPEFLWRRRNLIYSWMYPLEKNIKSMKPKRSKSQKLGWKKAKVNPARDTVLSTPELLENILFQLDMKTLLLSQRVSWQSKATIDSSALLQQALFFELAHKHGERFGSNGVNPFIIEHNHSGQQHGPLILDDSNCRRPTFALVEHYIQDCCNEHEGNCDSAEHKRDFVLFLKFHHIDYGTYSSAAREHGSWTRMYPAQKLEDVKYADSIVEAYFRSSSYVIEGDGAWLNMTLAEFSEKGRQALLDKAGEAWLAKAKAGILEGSGGAWAY